MTVTKAVKGSVWWVDFPVPKGSEPGYRRPVVIIQCDDFNRSQLPTVVALVLTSNLKLAKAPGNLVIAARDSGLPAESVANVSQIATVDRSMLSRRAGRLSSAIMSEIDRGIRLVLGL